MEAETSDTDDLDDLIFEKRNRDYGAYSIRKTYSKNMITGLTISISLVSLLIIVPHVLSQFGSTGGIVPATSTFELPRMLQAPPMIELFKARTPPPSITKFTEVVPKVMDTPEEVPSTAPQEPVVPVTMGEQSMTSHYALPTIVVTPAVAEPKVLQIVEVSPVYEGGEKELVKFIKRNIRFPRSARDAGRSGTVLVSFVVDSEGEVIDVKIVSSFTHECDKEAARVIAKMPGWKAGIQNHQPVPVRMILPIRFQLQE